MTSQQAPATAAPPSFAGPNFFIVGAPKCGTTAWANYLSSHPGVFFPSSKEPHFFNTDQPRFRWAKTQQEYFSYYANYAQEPVVADASVQYLYSQEAAKNIAAFNPSARILIMLRQPSAFIRSYHNQQLMNCDESITDLRRAWDLSGHRTPQDIPAENREASFLDYKQVGLFSEQVVRYLDQFDSTQIMVVFMEDWIQAPRALYLRLMDFLELDDDGREDFPKVHAAKTDVNRRLHRLTKHPPKALKYAVQLLRRITGLKEFKAADVLRKVNVREGYSAPKLDTGLAREIDQYFAEDQARLQEILRQVHCTC